ncbi:MAG: hypothetical protein ACYCST_07175 [Acidimicrobiales bacterium]
MCARHRSQRCGGLLDLGSTTWVTPLVAVARHMEEGVVEHGGMGVDVVRARHLGEHLALMPVHEPAPAPHIVPGATGPRRRRITSMPATLWTWMPPKHASVSTRPGRGAGGDAGRHPPCLTLTLTLTRRGDNRLSFAPEQGGTGENREEGSRVGDRELSSDALVAATPWAQG